GPGPAAEGAPRDGGGWPGATGGADGAKPATGADAGRTRGLRQQQWRASAWPMPPTWKVPTAHTLPVPLAEIPNRWLLSPGAGVVTRAHVEPFQCSTRVWVLPPPAVSVDPAAHALLAETAVTPARSLVFD